MAEKILIVDDDIDSLKLIGLMLQRHGYEVVAANSGSQALGKADAELPNLIILDVMMPDMNGLEVSKRLRQNPRTQKIPIIMFTAKTLIDDKVKGFEAGADDYLTKPTHPAELASRVKAILARSAAKQAAENNAAGNSSAAEPVAPRRGSSIGVIGAKGGVGTTTVALNLATGLLQAGEQPILVDFRLGVGSLGVSMGFARSQGLARLLQKGESAINPQAVEGELVTHQSGLRLLLSTSNPQENQIQYDTNTALSIVRNLRTMAQPLVADLGSGLTDIARATLSEFDRIIVIVEPNKTTLSMAQNLIQEMESQTGAGRLNVVVVNRAQSSLQTPWHEVENMLGRDVKAIISSAPELAFQASENGVSMVQMQPNAIVSTQFIKLADEMKSRIRSVGGR